MQYANPFSACEALFSKHAPRYLAALANDIEEPPLLRVTSCERRRMRAMRRRGRTVEQVAAHFGVAWRTAWLHSRLREGGK